MKTVTEKRRHKLPLFCYIGGKIMGFLDNIYWKVKLFLSEWWAEESVKIDKAAARFKRWLDGE